MNPAAILALISNLYEQVVQLQQRIAELEAARQPVETQEGDSVAEDPLETANYS